MSVLNALDATRLCTRWSAPLSDPAVWARPVPVAPRPAPAPPGVWSWRALARNPQALLLTGLVGTGMATDVVLRLVR